jgi:hypothetical protein
MLSYVVVQLQGPPNNQENVDCKEAECEDGMTWPDTVSSPFQPGALPFSDGFRPFSGD